MPPICFKTVKISNKRFHIAMCLIMYLSLLSFIPIIWMMNFYFFIIIYTLICVISHIDNKFTMYDFDKNLCFNGETLNVGSDSIAYDCIDKIVINVNTIKGDLESLPSRGRLIPIISKGTDNSIKIICKREKKTYKILCETNCDYVNLKSVGTFLKEKGMRVKISEGSYWER